MSDPSQHRRSMQGQVLRLSERREVAIFLRDGALWVADFVDGDGALMDAITWFRYFNCSAQSTSDARRRLVLESATPLSEELVERIERLHCHLNADSDDSGMNNADHP
jgi:hypothetical protein